MLMAGFTILFTVALFILIPKLKAKYPNLSLAKYLTEAKNKLDVLGMIAKMFPMNSKQAKLVDQIIHYTKLAVEYVEELYKAEELQASERKDKAKDFVVKAMKENGTDLDSKQLKFVDGLIESMVFMLPKTHK